MLNIVVTKIHVIVVVDFIVDVDQRRQVAEAVIWGVVSCATGTRMGQRMGWHEVGVKETRRVSKTGLVGRENKAGSHLKVGRRRFICRAIEGSGGSRTVWQSKIHPIEEEIHRKEW
jgi:hypothetical protein